MPMHDWTRVFAGTYHDFHCRWLPEISKRLNEGLLPPDHYSQLEQVLTGMNADVLTLRLEADVYAAMARQVTIRHVSDHRIVAVVEVVSPGNKAADYPFRVFLDKTLGLLAAGCHLLVIDPFPPGPRDPGGIHTTIWGQLGGVYAPPADKPLTMAAYMAGPPRTAYVEPLAVGDPLVDMPLFLTPDRYVPVPLEATYQEAYLAVPRLWRDVLEGRRDPPGR